MVSALELWGTVAVSVALIGAGTHFYLKRHHAERARAQYAAETAGFEARIPVTIRSRVLGLVMPKAEHGDDGYDPTWTNVLVSRDGVFLEAERVDDLTTGPRPQRLDRLFNALKVRRRTWQELHPDQNIEAVVAFWADAKVPLLAFKSALQTAKFAGFGGSVLLARAGADTRRIACLHVDATAPYWVDEPERKRLDLRVFADRFTLAWSDAEQQPSERPLAELASAARDAAQTRAAELEPNQRHEVLLLLPNEASVESLASTLDALPTASFQAKLSLGTPAPHAAAATDDANAIARVRMGATTVSGRLEPALIQSKVREAFPALRACYERGLKRAPNLEGKAQIHFVIDVDGKVVNAEATRESTLTDSKVLDCIVGSFEALRFPHPEGGFVAVVYPIVLSPH